MQSTAVIIAAGLGTRMKSALPKAAHKIAGRPMLAHIIAAAAQVFERIVVVIGPDMPALAKLAAPHEVVVQHERLGTAHATRMAESCFGEGPVAVFYADNPLVSAATMRALKARLEAGDAGLVLLGMTPPEPGKYGRLVTEGGYVTRIVEYADADEAERAIGFCNAGGLIARGTDMRDWLAEVGNDNAKGEYYLTDIVAIARGQGINVAALEAPYAECMGVNSRAELAQAEAVFQTRARAAAMADGVGMQAPETVFLAADTVLGEDVLIGPHVVFGPGVVVERGVEIKAFSHLEGCVVRAGAVIGPYARLRPGADVGEDAHVGNFVELKAATLGKGAKANHLTYIGDAEIGAGSNIGAGTITCNYDGKAKHKTIIGEKAFIGSNTALVAPVRVGAGALVGAGSVITKDVPDGALAVARGRQVTKAR
ncbi:bifunctional UDP-N-acetylglucosamine diphosphorylase/glucosamine-1-phosphate N-acetyltransferase GlmU [Acidocella sp. KAb 2-4]|uniref:bifunctional UDP-N-acetylglucosamine diphosphorylase/glucosamine-1-phosphate N-acetyltransferase GlmU n=1 Tax=Acidocella sp. KAb 2-4 TaxID=2885158 RepID=UPI001D087950|nr:bifunctional UDP-N-acetylglucosamine diphosphorylase/glucosamine-1-phosphate N-acetyltransferase GlmU [Acidocella sp. KAb 2-4]MCB5945461.1 bifunctional UDP-N-acetylglucosamine diphosphorylase/glucosamine-1-phosphate N-acetyltransferase GlmU [Acidocella sp. KAb 2-4]